MLEPSFLIQLIGYATLLALWLIAWAKLFDRAGLNPWLSLLMLVPVTAPVVFLWFAFGRWPIEDRMKTLEHAAIR